ncbi:MAG TPA: hypothetical protein HA261_13450 [Methanosarcina sp.]|nr:hypothetical protein [Methanosarcina sp.]
MMPQASCWGITLSPPKPKGLLKEISFSREKCPVENATAYIQLEDVSLADAPSTVIAETSIDP